MNRILHLWNLLFIDVVDLILRSLVSCIIVMHKVFWNVSMSSWIHGRLVLICHMFQVSRLRFDGS